jgi:hypothetical protein
MSTGINLRKRIAILDEGSSITSDANQINFTGTGITATASGNNVTVNVTGPGITVGTTAVTSGTIGRVFFEGTGNVVQQSASLFWDNTNARLGVGKTPDASSAKMVVAIADGTANQNYYLTLRNTAAGFGGWGFVKLGSNDLGITYETNTDAPSLGTSMRFYYGGNSAFGGSLSVGTLTTPAARLDVRAQGALSTDIAFRVRNSADTVDLVRLNGNGTHFFFNSNGTTNINFYEYGHGIWANGGSSFRIKNLNGSTSIEGATSTRFITDVTNKAITFDGRQLHIGGQALPTINGDSCIIIESGTAPTTALSDRFYLYSADITAGNAAPHFRTENGSIVKLYQNTAVTTPQGIADALTNLGVLATSTIAPAVQSVASAATVTPTFANDLVKITAQAVALTLAAPTGTAIDGKDLVIRIKDNGSAQTITWTSGTGGYRAIGVTLPTTTTAGKTTYVGLIYNSDDSVWDAIGVTTQA